MIPIPEYLSPGQVHRISIDSSLIGPSKRFLKFREIPSDRKITFKAELKSLLKPIAVTHSHIVVITTPPKVERYRVTFQGDISREDCDFETKVTCLITVYPEYGNAEGIITILPSTRQ